MARGGIFLLIRVISNAISYLICFRLETASQKILITERYPTSQRRRLGPRKQFRRIRLGPYTDRVSHLEFARIDPKIPRHGRRQEILPNLDRSIGYNSRAQKSRTTLRSSGFDDHTIRETTSFATSFHIPHEASSAPRTYQSPGTLY